MSNELNDPARILAELERIAEVGTFVWVAGKSSTWSPGFYRLLEIDPAVTDRDEKSRAFASRVHPEDRGRIAALTQHVQDKPGPPPVTEFRVVLPTRGVRWLRAHGTVFREPEGDVVSFGAFVDITELKRAYEKELLSRWSLEEAQRVSHVGLFVYDLERGAVTWNEALRELMGLTPDEPLTPEQVVAFNHPDDRELVARWTEAILAGEQKGPLRTRAVRRDGKVRLFEYTAAVRSTPVGSARVLLGVAKDVTDEAQMLERLRHASTLEAVGTLAAGVAHDVNNALTVITNTLAVLERRSDAPELVKDAQRAVDQCSTLTQQLLAFARRQPTVPRVLDVNALMLGFSQMIRRVLRPDISLAVEASSEPANVTIDPAHLEAVLMNLAVNARDAMPRGGSLAFRVDVVGADEPRPADAPRGAVVRIDVEDSGVGISPAHLEHIFQPYFTTKSASKGTGLGLASVFGTMQQNGGAVTVTSAEGRGTCFSLWLPRESRRPSQPEIPVPAGASKNAVILVVDDMDLVRRATSRMLQAAGYRVLDAPGGQQALDLFSRGAQVDLVLSDLLMPGMDGRALAQALRERGVKVPFIFLTGYADADAGLDDLAEMGRVLLKPFRGEKLFALIEESLRR